MICESQEQAIEKACEYIRQGHRVIFARGDSRHAALQAAVAISAIADKLEYEGWADIRADIAGVWQKGRQIVVQRVPFGHGSGLHGWAGAIVLHPSVSATLFGGRRQSVFELIRHTHERAGVVQ
jgi:nickel-dependent lactate racemase